MRTSICELPKFVQIEADTTLAGIPMPRSRDLNKAKKRFMACRIPLTIPPGTYRRAAHDDNLALLEVVWFGEPWVPNISWVTRTRHLLPRPTLYSRELPFKVPPQDLRRPCIHPNAPRYPSSVWRYMNFRKFESMLREGGIFLARSDCVSDPREGTLSLANLRNRAEIYRDWRRKMADRHTALVRELGNIKRWTYLSCWRIDERESQRSWNVYVRSNDGVAIQTTYRKLLERTATIFCTGVEYIDYETNWVVETEPMWPFSYKSSTFKWEREFRIIIQQFPRAKPSFDDARYCSCAEENPACGIILRVDLKRLINKIVVAPRCSPECYARVQRIAAEYDVGDRVMRSALE